MKTASLGAGPSSMGAVRSRVLGRGRQRPERRALPRRRNLRRHASPQRRAYSLEVRRRQRRDCRLSVNAKPAPDVRGGLRGRRLRRAIYRGPSWPPSPRRLRRGAHVPGRIAEERTIHDAFVAPGAGPGVFAGAERDDGQLSDEAAFSGREGSTVARFELPNPVRQLRASEGAWPVTLGKSGVSDVRWRPPRASDGGGVVFLLPLEAKYYPGFGSTAPSQTS